MFVIKPRLKKTILAAVALVVLGAGTAAAVLARSGRDVTTTSAEAYGFYQKGLEAERRMYHKDALAFYAKALELDPHFTMATLRLAGNIASRDRERARSLVRESSARKKRHRRCDHCKCSDVAHFGIRPRGKLT